MENIDINISIGELLRSSWRKCGILSTVTFCLGLLMYTMLIICVRIIASRIFLFLIALFTLIFLSRMC